MSKAEPTEPPAQSPQGHSRRAFLGKLGATGLAIGGAGAVGSNYYVGEADAFPCGGLCVGAIAVGGSAVSGAALGWTLREHEIVGKDDPPEGLTAEALENEVFNTAQARHSNNASTFIDNQNILDGAKHVAYSDAKIAAIEALNDQKSESDVTSAAQAAVDDYETTLKKNLFKSWNESVSELESLRQAVSEHSDLSTENIFQWHSHFESYNDLWDTNTVSHTLPDGSEFDLKEIGFDDSATDNYLLYTPIEYDSNHSDGSVSTSFVAINTSAGDLQYLKLGDWQPVYDEITSVCTDVRDGITTWVSEVYDEVQAGELNTEDLLTPRELAELSNTEEDDFNQAVADLLALNIPIDLEREAEIDISSANTTLYGLLGVTSEVTLEAGDEIDPANVDEDYYLTYDVSEANGDWTAFETAVDGGIVTFTDEPHPEMLYQIETTADETAEVSTDDFSETDDGGAWEVDISEQVETAITEVDSISFYAASDETNNVTVQLDEPFEIVGWTDDEGEEVDSVDYSSPTEPESDDNYITEEEWQEREENYKELIDKYEEETSGGGGWLPGIDIGVPGGGIIAGVVMLFGIVWGAGKILGNSN